MRLLIKSHSSISNQNAAPASRGPALPYPRPEGRKKKDQTPEAGVDIRKVPVDPVDRETPPHQGEGGKDEGRPDDAHVRGTAATISNLGGREIAVYLTAVPAVVNAVVVYFNATTIGAGTWRPASRAIWVLTFWPFSFFP